VVSQRESPTCHERTPVREPWLARGGHDLSVNSDPTKPGQLTTPRRRRGRNVNFLVDGGDNTDDTIGGALPELQHRSGAGVQHPDAAIQAEYGRTTGGVLTVVTQDRNERFRGKRVRVYRSKSLNENQRLRRMQTPKPVR